MIGHALPAVTDAIGRRAAAGITTMLASDDAVWVSQEFAAGRRLPGA